MLSLTLFSANPAGAESISTATPSQAESKVKTLLNKLINITRLKKESRKHENETKPESHFESNIEASHRVNNIAYGELLFHYYKMDPLKSMTHILVENDRNSFHEHQDHANILQGSLYLSLGMNEHAEAIFTEAAENSLNIDTRNLAWIKLAELMYVQNRLKKTKYILTNKIKFDNYYENIIWQENKVRELLSLIYLKEKQNHKAIEQLQAIHNDSLMERYAKYNLAVAFFAIGENDSALIQLQSLMPLPVYNEEEDAIRDKAALALGQHFLQQNKPYLSRKAYSEVRLNGPFANEALLGLGWANLNASQITTALAPWVELTKRDVSQKPVQEALLMTPRAYEQLNAFQSAFNDYLKARKIYENEITKINEITNYISNKNWLSQLKPDSLYSFEFNHSHSNLMSISTPLYGSETGYLYELFSSNSFNQGFQQYWELSNLENYLINWQSRLDVYKLMLDNKLSRKKSNHSKLINKINAIDIDRFSSQLDNIKKSHSEIPQEFNNIFLLAKQNELKKVNTLNKLENIISRLPENDSFDNIKSRFRIIRGTLLWNIKYHSYRSSYKARKDLVSSEKELNNLLETIKKLQNEFIYNPNNLLRYKKQITSFESQIDSLLARTRELKLIQQNELQLVASTWLNNRLIHTSNLLARTQVAIGRLQDKAASGAQ